MRFIRGHARGERRDTHTLTDIDTQNRRATCSRCGLVSIKTERSTKSGWKCMTFLNTQHRLSDIDADARRAWCRGCMGEVDILPRSSGGGWRCAVVLRSHQARDRTLYKDQRREAMRAWREKNKDKLRSDRLEKSYGITVEEYDAMLARQDGKCAICGVAPDDGKVLHVDHCHSSLEVRGLLCGQCNTAIGLLRDDPEVIHAALKYVAPGWRWEP